MEACSFGREQEERKKKKKNSHASVLKVLDLSLVARIIALTTRIQIMDDVAGAGLRRLETVK